jgi:hypothetical protein
MQPVPENFKRLLLAELSTRIPESAGTLPAMASDHRQPARQFRARWRSHPVLTGAAGMAGAAALGISLLVVGSSPAAAWTVTKEHDGTIAITIRQLNQPNALREELRRDGAPVDFNGPLAFTRQGTPNLACIRPMSPALRRALSVRTSADPHAAALLVRPSAIPRGDTLSIYWAAYSPQGFTGSKMEAWIALPAAGNSRPGRHKAVRTYQIPLTISGDFAFQASFVDSSGRCVQ